MVWVMVVPAVDAIVVGRFCPTGGGVAHRREGTGLGWSQSQLGLAMDVGASLVGRAWPTAAPPGGMAGDMESSAGEGFGDHGLPGHRADDAVDP